MKNYILWQQLTRDSTSLFEVLFMPSEHFLGNKWDLFHRKYVDALAEPPLKVPGTSIQKYATSLRLYYFGT